MTRTPSTQPRHEASPNAITRSFADALAAHLSSARKSLSRNVFHDFSIHSCQCAFARERKMVAVANRSDAARSTAIDRRRARRPQGAKAEPWKGCVRACVTDECLNGLVTDHLHNTSFQQAVPQRPSDGAVPGGAAARLVATVLCVPINVYLSQTKKKATRKPI